jgi:hypothetical protein
MEAASTKPEAEGPRAKFGRRCCGRPDH